MTSATGLWLMRLRLTVLFACLGLLLTSSAMGQDKLKVNEKVEVFFLNEWRPGTVRATDKNDNARVEFEFAASTQTQDFLRAVIRRPHEAGAIIATKTYSDKTGKFKISAAVIAITEDTIRIRKADMTEKDVPLASLSEVDQKFIKAMVRKGAPTVTKLPPKNGGGDGDQKDANGMLSRWWMKKNGEKIQGTFVNLVGNEISIRLASGETQILKMQELSTADIQHAIEARSQLLAAQNASISNRGGANNPPMDVSDPARGSVDPLGSRVPGPKQLSPEFKPPAEKKLAISDNGAWIAPVDSWTRPKWVSVPDGIPAEGNMGELQLSSASQTSLFMLGRKGDSMVGVDLVAGKTISGSYRIPKGEAGERVVPLDVSPSGKFVLANASAINDKSAWDTLAVYQLDSGDFRLKPWCPFGNARTILHAQFVGEDHLLAVSTRGDTAVWDIESQSLVWWTVMRGGCVPATSPSLKHVFLHTRDRLVVVESLTGKVVSHTASDPTGVRFLLIDDNCEQLMGVGNGQVKVWSMRDGRLTHEFGVSTMLCEPNAGFWLSPTQVLVSTSWVLELIDLSKRASIGCYSLNQRPDSRLRTAYFAVRPSNKSIRLEHPDLLHSEMAQVIANFDKRIGVDLRPGGQVKLEMNIDPAFDKEVEKANVEKLIRDAGYVISDKANVTFVANRRKAVDQGNKDLNEIPDEAFGPTQDFGIKVGNNLIWRATKDFPGMEKGNVWSGYVIPPEFRFSADPLPCFTLDPSGWIKPTLQRDYSQGRSERISIRNGGGLPGTKP